MPIRFTGFLARRYRAAHRPSIAPRYALPGPGIAGELQLAACSTADPITRATLNDLIPRVARLEATKQALMADAMEEAGLPRSAA